MCMLCNEIPIEFYLNKLGAYLQNEVRSVDEAKKELGLDDETYDRLLEDERFKELISKL